MPLTEFDKAWLRGQGLDPENYQEVVETQGPPQAPVSQLAKPEEKKKGYLSQIWDAANYRFIPELAPNLIPRVSPSEVSQAFGQGPAKSTDTIANTAAGLINAAGSAAGSLLTPINIATAGLPLLGKLPGLSASAISGIDKVSRLASAGFAGEMAYNVPEQVRQIQQAAKEGDVSGVTEGSAGLGIGSAFGAGMLRHAIKGSGINVDNIGGSEGKPRQILQLPEKTESTLESERAGSTPEQVKARQDAEYGQWVKDKVEEQLGKQLTPSEYQKIINESLGVDPNKVNLINQDLNLMRPSHRNFDPENLTVDKQLERLYKKPKVVDYNVEKPKAASELEPYLVENERFKAKMEKIPVREVTPEETFKAIQEMLFNPEYADRVTPEMKDFYAEYMGGVVGEAWKKLKKPTSGIDIPIIGEERPTSENRIVTGEEAQPGSEIIPSTTIEKLSGEVGRELPTKYSEEFPGQELRSSESPTVVTSEMRRELSKLGWSDAAIEKMSPATAKLNLDEQAGPGVKYRSNLEKVQEPVRGKGMKIKLGSKEGAFLNLGGDRDFSQRSLELPEEKRKIPSNILSPQIDKRVRSGLGKFGDYVADKFMKFHDYSREYTGRFENRVEQLFRDARESKTSLKGLGEAVMGNLLPKDQLELHNILITAKRSGRLPEIPEKFRELVPAIHEFLKDVHEEQRALNIPVKEGDTYRLPESKPYHYPEGIASTVINELIQNPASERVKQLKQDYIDFQVQQPGMTLPKAEKRLTDVLNSFQSSEEGNLASQFGAIDKAEGYGIPNSWQETNPFVNLRRYARRAGRRFAYHKALESDPIMREALGVNTDVWGNPTPKGQRIPGTNEPVFNIRAMEVVKPVLRAIEGKMRNDEVKYDTLASMGKSVWLGPMVGLGNLTSSQFLGFQHATLGQILPSKVEALRNLGHYMAKSLESGSNRRSIGSLITNENALHDPVVLLRNIRDVINNVSGASLFEYVQRSFNFGEGAWIAHDNYKQLLNGKRGYQALKFFKDFAPDNSWKEMLQNRVPELPEDYRNKMAAKYLDSVQGTYTLENLPRLATEGPLAPLLTLSRWSIEKMNNYEKYVLNPALNGNFQPLLMSTIGLVAGGVLMQALREKVTGRKDKSATTEELKTAFQQGDPGWKKETLYKLLSLASLSSYAGILSQTTKDFVDLYRGGQARGIENPLVGATADTIKLVTQAVEAMDEGEKAFPTMLNLISEILSRNVQAYRMVLQNVGPETIEKTGVQNKTRDLEMFKRLHGEEVKMNPQRDYNPFEGAMIRKFKQTQDPEEAGKLLPDIAQQVLEQNRFTPEKIESKLRSLGNMPVRYIPDPLKEPEKFEKYITWVAQTQGKETAIELLRQYAKQVEANEAKKMMVR